MSDAEELILRPSKRKWLLLFLGFISLTCMGVFIIVKGGGWLGWLNAGIGCLFSFGSLTALCFNRSYLRLHAVGFTMHNRFRSTTYRWEDVAGFGVAAIGSPFNKLVVFVFSDSYKRLPMGRSVGLALVGFDGFLGDTYSMKAADLAALMNTWRLRALIGKPSDGAQQ